MNLIYRTQVLDNGAHNMGTFSIEIDAKTGPFITVVSDIVTTCYTQREITVNAGTNAATYYVAVEVSASAIPQQQAITETISADKTYYLNLEGFNATDNNPFRSRAILIVRDTNANGEILAVSEIRRSHTENIC